MKFRPIKHLKKSIAVTSILSMIVAGSAMAQQSLKDKLTEKYGPSDGYAEIFEAPSQEVNALKSPDISIQALLWSARQCMQTVAP